jgi:hypothetical protein
MDTGDLSQSRILMAMAIVANDSGRRVFKRSTELPNMKLSSPFEESPTFSNLWPVDFWSRFVYRTQQTILHSEASNAPSFNEDYTEDEQLQLTHSFAIFIGKEMNKGRTLRAWCDKDTVEAWKKGMKNI